MLTEKAHQQNSEEKEKKKEKIKLNSILKRLKKINKNKIKISEEEEDENQKRNLRFETDSFLPKISASKTLNIDRNRKIEEPEGGIETERKRLNEEKKKVLVTVSNSLTKNFSLKDKRVKNKNNYSSITAKSFFFTPNKNKYIEKDNKKRVETLENMYLNCIKGLEYLDFLEENKPKLTNMKSYKIDKIDKNTDLKKRLYNKDKLMKKFLVENINALNKDKTHKKEEQILKDYVQLKLKKDPIIKLSEKLAYFGHKPLLSLFNHEDREEKAKYSFLAQLKLKDKHIMKKLDNDNRDMNLLMKRLDEDQKKYEREGYFIITKEKEKEDDKKRIKLKKINNNENIKNNEHDEMMKLFFK